MVYIPKKGKNLTRKVLWIGLISLGLTLRGCSNPEAEKYKRKDACERIFNENYSPTEKFRNFKRKTSRIEEDFPKYLINLDETIKAGEYYNLLNEENLKLENKLKMNERLIEELDKLGPDYKIKGREISNEAQIRITYFLSDEGYFSKEYLEKIRNKFEE